MLNQSLRHGRAEIGQHNGSSERPVTKGSTLLSANWDARSDDRHNSEILEGRSVPSAHRRTSEQYVASRA
eukprot:1679427-Prymnesium_polylepis.1